MDDLATRQADTKFAELVCADPEWLRAEFDALISASFGAPPKWPRPPAPPRARYPIQSGWPRQPASQARPEAAETSIRSPEFRRQRSPPGDG